MNNCTAFRGVRRNLKRGVTKIGRDQQGVREGDVPEARKPSGAVPFKDIISLRNKQDSTNKLASVILLGFFYHKQFTYVVYIYFSVVVTMNQC